MTNDGVNEGLKEQANEEVNEWVSKGVNVEVIKVVKCCMVHVDVK